MRPILLEAKRIAYHSQAFLGALLFSILLALGASYLPERAAAVHGLVYGYYWTLVILCGWFVVSVVRSLPKSFCQVSQWSTSRGLTVALVFAVALAIHSQEDHEYKTLADEPAQVGISLMMHRDRQATVPIRAHYLHGDFKVLEASATKRAALYCFLVACVHDLTGYRMENAFVVNGIMTVICLTLAYFLGKRLGGPNIGRMAVLLLGGIPMFARMACGAGFELTNLTLMLAVVLAAIHHLDRPTDRSTTLLCLLSLLLCHCRMESVVFLAGTGATLLAGWWRDGRILPSLGLLASPLLMVPYVWRFRIFEGRPETWQMWSLDAEKPFELSNIPEQAVTALKFLLSPHDHHDTSVPLVTLGLIALVGVIAWCLQQFHQRRRWTPPELGFAIFFPLFGLLILLLLSYYWPLDSPIVSRLMLPFFLPLVFALVLLAGRYLPRRAHWIPLALSALLFLGYGLPKIARHQAATRYQQADHLQQVRDFIALKKGETFTVVTFLPVIWINEEVAALSVRRANANLDKIATFVDHPLGTPLYYHETIAYHPQLPEGVSNPFGKSLNSESAELDDAVIRQPLMQFYDSAPFGWRISEITGVEGVAPIGLHGMNAAHMRALWHSNLP